MNGILERSGVRLASRGLAAAGGLIALYLLVQHGIWGWGGAGGTDALAYWSTARELLGASGSAPGGGPLFGFQQLDAEGARAFVYPPLFAQVIAPLALLPGPVFVWVWRGLCVLGLRAAVGSWTAVGLAILVFPPVILELDLGNVNLLVAAVCAMAMRGNATAVGAAGAAKLAGLPLLPLAWVRDRRGLLIGLGVVALATAVSIAVSPSLWLAYGQFLASSTAPTYWTNLGSGIPLVVRLIVALVLGVAATRWLRLAPLAVVVGLPVLWINGLSILVATVTPLTVRVPDRTRVGALAEVPSGA